jgi:hypothetical protein
MSYDPSLGARPYGATDAENDGDAKKGSVRAARERMQAAQKRTQLPDTSKIIGLPRRPNQHLPSYTSQNNIEAPQESEPSGSRGDVDSDPPSPQWPLPNNATPAVPPRSPNRLQPPPQSFRPVSDDYPIQQLSPDYPLSSPNYLQPPSPGYAYPDDDALSPGSFRSSRPFATSSIASASSLGSIPDFPVPQPPLPVIQQTRRTPSLGPPPSSRRGPSSYYTQMSYVSPIAEESETRSAIIQSRHGSFASSNVFPTNNDDFYPDGGPYSDDDETISSDRGTPSPTDHDDRSGLVAQSPALVRQASLGRRTKPSLMTIKSLDSLGERKSGSNKKNMETVGSGAGALGIGSAMLAARDGVSSGPGRSNLSIVETSSSDSLSNFTGTASPSYPFQQETGPSFFGDRAGMRRPPKLDMDAVRDAEARGSLTSLPELIRRATRLAANLDRGQTASRMGLAFWESGAPDRKDARQSGLSDMLAAFPPPGQDTPQRSGTPNYGSGRSSKWQSGTGNSRNGVTDSRMSNEKARKRRRCCGIPLWTFITLLIVLLFIIAAAVVIPVVLVVIPNQNKNNSAEGSQGSGTNNNNNMSNTNVPALPVPTSDAGDGQCAGVITCQNGGVAILNSDRSCNCVCINGFTGRTCTNDDATGCTTTSIAGTANNATMGSGIPRLFEDAVDKFNIPLDSTRILSLFSTLSLSCAAENALITFNGLASRSIPQHLHSMNVRTTLHSSRTLPMLHHPHPAKVPGQSVKRQTVGESEKTKGSSGQKATQPETILTQPVSSNIESLDYARIGVLLALQESGDLDVAASAQESIQTFLTNDRSGSAGGSSIDVGPFEMDLVNFTIQFQNGTMVRGPPLSSSST